SKVRHAFDHQEFRTASGLMGTGSHSPRLHFNADQLRPGLRVRRDDLVILDNVSSRGDDALLTSWFTHLRPRNANAFSPCISKIIRTVQKRHSTWVHVPVYLPCATLLLPDRVVSDLRSDKNVAVLHRTPDPACNPNQ